MIKIAANIQRFFQMGKSIALSSKKAIIHEKAMTR